MNSDKKKILIFFDGSHVAYSPTVTQLYDALSERFEVFVLAEDPKNDSNQKLPGRNVLYYRFKSGLSAYFYRAIFRLLTLFDKRVKTFSELRLGYSIYFSEFLLLKRILKKNRFDRIIAVDLKNLYLCLLLSREADLLSLELCKNEHLVKFINLQAVPCVLIQSEVRKNYLFKYCVRKVFYVQNAPVYKNIPVKKIKKGLIFSGTAWNEFGIYHCLDYLVVYPEEKLTIQGVVFPADKKRIDLQYRDLLKENRLIINNSYIENDLVETFISGYEIGFCFYNFDVPWLNNYNYMTAPSGKLFKYLAAGVPVVAIDIPGFSFIKNFECGILIERLDTDAIRGAVVKIRDNYDFYVRNAIEAAKYFSFDKAIKPYLDYIAVQHLETESL